MELNFRQFVESKLGSFTYGLPKDKEEQLYDFYLLSALPITDDDSLNLAREQTRDMLLPTLKRNLLDAVFFSITAELRHAFGDENYNGDIHKILSPRLMKIFFNYSSLYYHDEGDDNLIYTGPKKGELEKYVRSWDAAKATEVPEREIVKLAQVIFDDESHWESGYGGRMWGNIAKGWLDLDRAENHRDMMVYIDRVYQLQHNNDTVFNKVMQYTKKGQHNWLKKALDHKFRSHPYELMDKASPSMKRLAGFIFKAAHGTTLKQFQQDREKEFESKFKDFGTRTIRLTDVEITISEKELKEFAKKVIGSNPEGAVADLSVKYGDILDSEYKFGEFIKSIGIRPRYNIRWVDIIDATRKKATKFVRNNFQKIHEIFSQRIPSGEQKQEIGDMFKVSLFFVNQMYYTYAQILSYATQRKSVLGNRISHTNRQGMIQIAIPGNLDPVLPGKGVTLDIYKYTLEKIKKIYDELGREQAEEYISKHTPISGLTKKAAKAILQYIIENYEKLMGPQ
jgi:hypothetical protein